MLTVYGCARVEHLSAQNRSSGRAEFKEEMFVFEKLEQDPFMCSAEDLHQARTMWCQPIYMAAHTTVVHPWFWIQNVEVTLLITRAQRARLERRGKLRRAPHHAAISPRTMPRNACPKLNAHTNTNCKDRTGYIRLCTIEKTMRSQERKCSRQLNVYQ